MLISIGVGHMDLPGSRVTNLDHQTATFPHHHTIIRECAYVVTDRIHLDKLVNHVGPRRFACLGLVPLLDCLLAGSVTTFRSPSEHVNCIRCEEVCDSRQFVTNFLPFGSKTSFSVFA